MTWEELVEKHAADSIQWHDVEKEGKTDVLSFVIDKATRLVCEVNGEVDVCYHAKNDIYYITLAKDRTPDQMDAIITALTEK
jgi:hypothetical protein